MNNMDDTIKIRFATDDDLQAVYENQARVYGNSVEPADIEAWKRKVNPEDILVAEDISDPENPFLVATSLYYRLRLTVPGGATLDAAWLAMITVAATHQRRGFGSRSACRASEYSKTAVTPSSVVSRPGRRSTKSWVPAWRAMPGHSTLIRIPRSCVLRPAETRPGGGGGRGKSHLPRIYDRWCATTQGAEPGQRVVGRFSGRPNDATR